MSTDLEKGQEYLESMLEQVFKPPKDGDERGWWWGPYYFHTIFGKGIVSVTLHDGTELTEEQQETAKSLW